MAVQAQVTSVEALESFRASLILYLGKARPALEAVQAEVLRTRFWLEHEQRIHWEHQVRRRTRELEEAQQALFSARLSNLRDATEAEQTAVHKAKRSLEQAETRLKILKRWSREYDSRIGPPAKQLDHLRDLLTTDLPRAIVFLAQAVNTLDAYTGIAPAAGASGGAPPAVPDVANGTDPSPASGPPPAPHTAPLRARGRETA